MNPIGDISLTLTGYLQDAAAAFLVVCIALVRIFLKRYPGPGDAAVEAASRQVCKTAARILRYSVCVIIVTAVPAAISFKGRGPTARGDDLIAAMAVKYAAMIALSGAAFFSWSRLSKKTGCLKSKHTIGD